MLHEPHLALDDTADPSIDALGARANAATYLSPSNCFPGCTMLLQSCPFASLPLFSTTSLGRASSHGWSPKKSWRSLSSGYAMGSGWNILLGLRALPRTRGARWTGRASVSPGGIVADDAVPWGQRGVASGVDEGLGCLAHAKRPEVVAAHGGVGVWVRGSSGRGGE